VAEKWVSAYLIDKALLKSSLLLIFKIILAFRYILFKKFNLEALINRDAIFVCYLLTRLLIDNKLAGATGKKLADLLMKLK